MKNARTLSGTVMRVTPVISHVVAPGSVSTSLCGQTPESTSAAIHILTSPLLFIRQRVGQCQDCLEWLHA